VTGNHDLDSRYLQPRTFDPKDALRALKPAYPVPQAGTPDPNHAYWADNVAVLIADRPSPAQIRSLGLRPHETLFGLYEGTPLGERGTATIWPCRTGSGN